MTLILALLVLGEISLCLEFGNRLLGSGVRTPAKTVAKIFSIVFACVLLAVPAFIVFFGPGSKLWITLFYASGFLGFLIFIHFLFPYRFGISRIKQEHSVRHKTLLTSKIFLHDECVSVPSLASRPDGLRFLVVSDLHCNSQKKLDFIKKIFAKLSNETFDAALLLGDLGENSRVLPGLIDTLANLPNRHGIFMVRGNHDFMGTRPSLIEDLAKHHSIKILSNTACNVPGLGIELIGLEYPPDGAQLPFKSEHTLRFGLTHTPDNIILFSRLGVDIGIAGHTHGGWVRLPVLGPLLVPSGLGRFLNRGWYRLGPTLMYITPGLPYVAEHKGKPGEILRLTLKPNQDKEGTIRIEDSMQ
jgi:predicted MPP superfamily phosphohydrolase